MQKVFILWFMILFSLVVSGCSDKSDTKEEIKTTKQVNVIKTGTKITLHDISSGAQYTLKRLENGFVVEGHEDKVIMFDFYATYCPPCKKEAPHLTDLQVKYSDKLLIIALNTFEEVDDKFVDTKFRYKYSAYYFISNSKENERIIQSALKDIKYDRVMQIPFKVVLKNGVYQKLTDIYDGNPNNMFYIGAVETSVIEKDLKKIWQ